MILSIFLFFSWIVFFTYIAENNVFLALKKNKKNIEIKKNKFVSKNSTNVQIISGDKKSMNESVENYLDYYCELKNPGFSVMLNGEWGSGKTWFINKYSKKYVEIKTKESYSRDIYENPFIILSFYGIKSLDELDEQIFYKIFDELYSPKVSAIVKYLHKILGKNLNKHISFSKKSMVRTFLRKLKNNVLVFDDLERCTLSIEETLGYINGFIEKESQRVLIIANEKELKEKNKEQNYSAHKSKVIGKIFEIYSDLNSAFNKFLNELKNDEIKHFLDMNGEVIKKIFNLSGYKNLRHLQQSFFDFEHLFPNIDKKFRDKADLMEELLFLFFVLSIEMKEGKIGESFFVSSNDMNQDKDTEKDTEILKKYGITDKKHLLFPLNILGEFFKRGHLTSEIITEHLNNSKYFVDEDRPTWERLYFYEYLDDAEFDTLLQKLDKEWEDNTFIEPEEILHIIGLFLRFSNLKLYNKNNEEIKTNSKQYIDKIKLGAGWKSCKPKEYMYLHHSGKHQLSYYEKENKSFQELQSYLKDSIKNTIVENLKNSGKELLELLSKDIPDFLDKINYGDDENIYHTFPIFKYIEPVQYLECFQKIKNSDKHRIIEGLYKRYSQGNIVLQDFRDEKSFFEELDSLITEKLTETVKNKISDIILNEKQIAVKDIIKKLST